VRSGDVVGSVVDAAPDGTGTVLRISFHTADLITHATAKSVRTVNAIISTAGHADEVTVHGRRLIGARRRVVRRGVRLFVITPTIDHRGRLVIATTPVSPRRIVGRLRRALR
jgi:hypothetical protein